MTDRDFTYWLQGFFEMSNPSTLSERQTRMIKEHLDLCFKKVTPYLAGDGATCGLSGTSSHGSCGTGGFGTCGTSGIEGTFC